MGMKHRSLKQRWIDANPSGSGPATMAWRVRELPIFMALARRLAGNHPGRHCTVTAQDIRPPPEPSHRRPT